MTTKEMKFQPLTSSNLEACHYDGKTLTVRFKNGGSYAYGGVTREHYEGLLNAKSPGKYFHATVRGKYKGAKL